MNNLLNKYGPLLAALCTVGLIYAGYAVWKYEASATSSSPSGELALKEKCGADGASYFNDTLLPQSTQQAIEKNNQDLRQQYGAQQMQQMGVMERISFGNQRYAYNPKLNTCLISYIETAVMSTGTVVDYYVKDIYTNKEVLWYFEVDGKPGNAGSSYEDFSSQERALMGE